MRRKLLFLFAPCFLHRQRAGLGSSWLQVSISYWLLSSSCNRKLMKWSSGVSTCVSRCRYELQDMVTCSIGPTGCVGQQSHQAFQPQVEVPMHLWSPMHPLPYLFMDFSAILGPLLWLWISRVRPPNQAINLPCIQWVVTGIKEAGCHRQQLKHKAWMTN